MCEKYKIQRLFYTKLLTPAILSLLDDLKCLIGFKSDF